jgi:23S rRNA (adenine2030-N6)-methyltransferase
LIACELEPKASRSLSRNLQGDARIKTLRIDGWTAMNAYVPPRERRGLVLVDPSFEADSDFPRLASGLAAAHRRWATGIYILWYPIKGRRQADAFAKQVRRLAIRALRAELFVGPPSDQNRLNRAGLIIVNPPWTLENDLSALLPALSAILGPVGKGGFRLDWLPPGDGGSMASFHSPAVGV